MTSLEIILFFIILIVAIKKPGVGLALFVNIYAIRSLVEINWNEPCYAGDCQINPNIILALILPVLSMLVIVINIYKNNKFIRYPLDYIDALLLLLTIILLIFSNFSPELNNSIEYFTKYVLIGLSYYIIGKIYLFNNNEYSVIKEIFLSFYFIGIFLSLLAYFILSYNNLTIIRLTLPGIHPIPFAQAIGLSFILSFSIFITDGKILKINNRIFIFLNNFVLLYLTMTLFATNTRGILLASTVSIFLFVILNPIKIKKIKIFIFSFLMLFAIVYMVTIFDIEFLFNRLLHSATDQSISDRFLAYNDSIKIFSEHIVGVGTGAFGFYSFLAYPHNMFLQNVAEYGIFGLLWNYLFIALIIYLLYLIYQVRNKEPVLVLLYIVFLYYFVETMFSFTLWMHKGLFLSLGLLSFVLFLYKKMAIKNNA